MVKLMKTGRMLFPLKTQLLIARLLIIPIFTLMMGPNLILADSAAGDSKAASASSKDKKRPNIIYILADDLGYGDLGCYGQKDILTPQLDQMAKEGIKFTQHYAGCTVCAPSRCSLMTGFHTGHARIRGNGFGLLEKDDPTLGKVFQAAGYDTAIIGKWGMGHQPPPGDPANNGFQEFYGYLNNHHAHNYYPDFLWKDSAKIPLKGNVVESVGNGGVAMKRSQYTHDLFEKRILDYLKNHQKKPFFLYAAFTIPHANNEARDKGMEVPDHALYAGKNWPEAQKNHAAMISKLDTTVGKILQVLKELEMDENTLVIFTSDNGPHKEGGADPKFFNSSGNLRGYKRDLYEGGIRVPFIARWPSHIKAGTQSDHISAFWDFLPTAIEFTSGKKIEKTDGISFLPELLGKTDLQKKHEYLYWEFHERGTRQAIRKGDWKYVKFIGGKSELFNLASDLEEKKNIAEKHPEIVKDMESILKNARTEHPDFPLKPVMKKKSRKNKSKKNNPPKK